MHGNGTCQQVAQLHERLMMMMMMMMMMMICQLEACCSFCVTDSVSMSESSCCFSVTDSVSMLVRSLLLFLCF